MIKLVQIRKDNDCLFSSEHVNVAFNFVDGLFTCQHAIQNSTKLVDICSYYIDFLVEIHYDCGDVYNLQFTIKLNFKMSNYDFNRILIDFVKPYLH